MMNHKFYNLLNKFITRNKLNTEFYYDFDGIWSCDCRNQSWLQTDEDESFYAYEKTYLRLYNDNGTVIVTMLRHCDDHGESIIGRFTPGKAGNTNEKHIQAVFEGMFYKAA